ncbi:MAG: DUF1269 domain-containing protein [Alphaproteobacteria bacterium]|jgi:uncharacterized membrane protein|nr:DUF1269 domain-containing protein [Rhizobiaceae bacterium]MBU3964093.1 DUF1269 domain-containing protein [Alphaproteobacteria bacterium]PJI44841.1 MAG: hypothetical protein CTR54_02365 [Rhizobium sp.]MBU4048289.1 DUF1269 domain-containing protein [Alphaproteobacteria bacterium]MBU4089167.1 DUF1269 domain-containing protein [Alphaproteobacteria bacterium]
MSELIVIGYPNSQKAEEARATLFQLAKEYLVEVKDAVVAEADDKGQIRLNQMVSMWSIGASGGAFWGLLAGMLFLNPLVGVAAGAGAGALAGALTDYGINDNFMKDVAGVLQPGQAALFILADRAASDKVIDRLSGHGGSIIRTNLDTSKEQELRAAFDKARTSINAPANPQAN